MRKGLLYLIILLCCSLLGNGQSVNSDTLFTLNNIPFPSKTFIKLYQNGKLLDEHHNIPPIDEALNLYIEFQVKALEAHKLQIDTIPEVQLELESYKNQAYDSYLYPVNITPELLQETFNRIQHFVKARHILVKIEGHATPKDTLEAYNEAKSIYKSLKKGKEFNKLADQHSDDLSVRKNDGETGYFTTFDMDYPFESSVYNTPKGEFSKPVRTKYGYHIIQPLDKIKNPGKLKVRHLMLEFSKNSKSEELKKKADSIYLQLLKGEDFPQLIHKYSNDITSKKNKGELPWFGQFETHKKIEKAAFQLKMKNEYSKPIKTEFGYHIIQLLDKKDYSSFDTCKEELLALLYNDDRSRISKHELIEKLKKEYQFTEYIERLANFHSILDYAYADLWQPLFTIDGLDYSQESFADFLSKQASKDIYENFKEYINRLYVSFTNNSILAHYKKSLQEDNPELKSLLKQYEDGVLVYFITKYKIWDQSTKNIKGLALYFKQNSEKYGKNADLSEIKTKVLKDYRMELEKIWLNELKKNYSLSIKKSTFLKIANNKNE